MGSRAHTSRTLGEEPRPASSVNWSQSFREVWGVGKAGAGSKNHCMDVTCGKAVDLISPVPSPIAARCKTCWRRFGTGCKWRGGRWLCGSQENGVWGDRSMKPMPLKLQNRGSQRVQDVLSSVVGMAEIRWALGVPLSSSVALLLSGLVHGGRCLPPRSKTPGCTRRAATTAAPRTGTPAPTFAGQQWINGILTARATILSPKMRKLIY